MGLALAIDFDEVEQDPAILDGTTKDCPACDADNPRAVAREGCKACNGTGRVALAAKEIAKELKASRTGEKSSTSDDDDDDFDADAIDLDDEGLFLEG